MRQPAAPRGLQDRILAAAAEAAATDVAPLETEADAADDGCEPDEIPAPIPMAPWMRGLAVAAALLLLVAGGFMFLRGDGGFGAGGHGDVGIGGSVAGSGDVQTAGIQLVELRQFVSKEHSRCDTDPARVGKFTKTELTEVPERYRSIMGAEVSIEEILRANLRLRGVGECHVPGPGRSIHLLLGADLPESEATLSLFVQQDPENRLGLEPGSSYEIAPRDPAAASISIVAWRRDGLTYFLVTDADACGSIREAMGRGGKCDKL